LIYYPKIEETFLFNLQDDPDEIYNLVRKENYPDRNGQLKQELRVAQKSVGDKLEIL